MTTTPNRLFSLEFFPPRTPEGIEKLRATRRQLEQLKPAFCSVTFGAGGSTREGTLAAGARVPRRRHGGSPAYFVHGRGARVDRRSARAVQVARDPPSRRAARRSAVRDSATPAISDSRASSSRSSARKQATGSTSTSPPTPNATRKPARRRRTSSRSSARSMPEPIRRSPSTSTIPMRIGTSSMRAARRGSRVPIVPGIMPIGSYTKLARFSDACGAEIPRWIRTKLEGYGDDIASIRAFGLDVVTDLRRPARPRRARPSLLHAEPGGAHHDDLAAPRALKARSRGLERPAGAYAPGVNDTSSTKGVLRADLAPPSRSPPFSWYSPA